MDFKVAKVRTNFICLLDSFGYLLLDKTMLFDVCLFSTEISAFGFRRVEDAITTL